MLGPRRPEDESSDESDHDCALFMKELPSSLGESNTLAALTALMEEETTAEQRAECHKLEGNELFGNAVKCPHADRKRQLFNEAYGYYTRALAEHSPLEHENSIYYSNRANVSFQLGNFGNAISDARWALKHNPGNHKAAFRAVMAAKAIDKHNLVLKYAKTALAMGQLDAGQRKLIEAHLNSAEATLERLSAAAEQEAARRAAFEQSHAEFFALKKRALEAREINLGRLRWKGADTRLITATRDAPSLDEEGNMYWPVLFLYDEHGQTDFIEQFCEHDTFIQHFQEMFPAAGCVPWDEEGKYVSDNLQLFLDIADENRLHRNYQRIDSNQSLLATLQKFHKSLPIPGLPVFYVLPKNSTHKLPE